MGAACPDAAGDPPEPGLAQDCESHIYSTPQIPCIVESSHVTPRKAQGSAYNTRSRYIDSSSFRQLLQVFKRQHNPPLLAGQAFKMNLPLTKEQGMHDAVGCRFKAQTRLAMPSPLEQSRLLCDQVLIAYGLLMASDCNAMAAMASLL